MKASLPRLHAVTTDRVLSRPDVIQRAQALNGIRGVAVHVRSGTAGGKRLTTVARTLVTMRGVVFVNDRADVAVTVNAAGIHLPAAGFDIADARRLVGATMIIGRSTHTPGDARRAHEQGADYVFLGPIWDTPSHPGAMPLGPDAITAAAPARVIAIGGVTPQRVSTCLECGAYGVAAVSALWLAPDPGSAAREMTVLLEGGTT